MAPAFDPSSILLLLVMALSTGVRDLASLLSTDSYWDAKKVAVSYDQLAHELDPIKPADISKLIGQLDAVDARDRDAASAKIAAVGPAAAAELADAVQNGSPEVVARAKVLLTTIRTARKALSIRRLMAIRTLGERKDPRAVAVLKPLADGTDVFESEYARSAIAAIEGKNYLTPAASEAQRAAELALLPGRLDAVMQGAPYLPGKFDLTDLVSQLPLDARKRENSLREARERILTLLETVGDIRLDVVTWGFYAAPPGQPGNSILILRGQFDEAAVRDGLDALSPQSRKVGGADEFGLGEDAALLLDPHRIVFLSREPTGNLAVDEMTRALKTGAGDFQTNADLSRLTKGIDLKSPIWAAAAISPGLAEIVGPLKNFTSVTGTAAQTLDEKKNLMTTVQLDCVNADAAAARQGADEMTQALHGVVQDGRRQQALLPFIKPMIDFAESVKIEVKGGKATMIGAMREMPLLPVAMPFQIQAELDRPRGN